MIWSKLIKSLICHSRDHVRGRPKVLGGGGQHGYRHDTHHVQIQGTPFFCFLFDSSFLVY